MLSFCNVIGDLFNIIGNKIVKALSCFSVRLCLSGMISLN